MGLKVRANVLMGLFWIMNSWVCIIACQHQPAFDCARDGGGGGGEKAVGIYTREELQHGEWITWVRGAAFLPGRTLRILETGFGLPALLPGWGLCKEQGFLFDRFVGFVVGGEGGTGRRLFLSPGPHALWKLDRMRCEECSPVMGWNGSSHELTCWRSHPQPLGAWLHLEIGSLRREGKGRPLGWG